MAWRPYEYLIGGEITFKKGKAQGWIYFLTSGLVRLNLAQEYIASGRVRFEKSAEQIQEDMKNLTETIVAEKRKDYLKGFSKVQKGKLGDFTTGKDDNKYADYFYFEWYSEKNGRIVYEGQSSETEILEPLVFQFPDDHRDNQQNLMGNFLTNMCASFTEKTKKPMVGIQFPLPQKEEKEDPSSL